MLINHDNYSNVKNGVTNVFHIRSSSISLVPA